MSYLTLRDIRPGEVAVVRSLRAVGSMRRRLLDLGFVKNTPVECIGRAPLGDPTAFLIRGALIALREENCRDIVVSLCRKEAGHGG